MYTVINAADDEYEIDSIKLVGPTMAVSHEDEIVFNHQTCYTYQLLKPVASVQEEANSIAELLKGKDVVICLNVNGMFEDYVDTYEELAEMDVDEDFYLEGTVLEVRPGQLCIQLEEDESEWIPFKHIDTIELSDESSDLEPFEVYEEE